MMDDLLFALAPKPAPADPLQPVRQALALLRAGDTREALAVLHQHPEASPAALAILNAHPLEGAWAAEAILEGALLPEAEKLARWRALVAPEPGVATSRPSGSGHAPRPRTDAPGAASRPSASQGQRPTPKSPPRASKRRKAQPPVTTGTFL